MTLGVITWILKSRAAGKTPRALCVTMQKPQHSPPPPALTRQLNSFRLHDAELLSFGNNEFEPDNARQSLLARIKREEAFEFELKRTGDVQYIERSATNRGGVLTT